MRLDDGTIRWVGTDERGRELEIIGVPGKRDPRIMIIIHVMPTSLRRKR